MQCGYLQELLSFAPERNESVRLLRLKKGVRRDRQPVVLALRGIGGNTEGMRPLRESYAYLGFLNVDMDARHHGERAKPIGGLPSAYQGAMLHAYRTDDTHSYLYETVSDVLRLRDNLATRADVDMSTDIARSG